MPRRKDDDPDVLYRAATGGRWRGVVLALAAFMFFVGYVLRWLVGDAPLALLAPYYLWPPATLLAIFALWRRGRSVEIRRHGIRLGSGGRSYGERQLVPWSSVTWFGGRKVRGGGVCLLFRQQHVARDLRLPGKPVSEDDFHRLIDRLRVVLGGDFPRLKIGGLEP